jgi:hypothetical protein
MPKRKKRTVKLQNKTNEGLFELDNVNRDYNKIQSVHRISPSYEAELYKKIGYDPSASLRVTSKVKTKLASEYRPATAEDLEDNDIQPTIISPNAFDVKKVIAKRQTNDTLSSSGIS